MLTGVKGITYGVRRETMDQWGAFWRALGGIPDSHTQGSLRGEFPLNLVRRGFHFGDFKIALLAPEGDHPEVSRVGRHIARHGDHSATRVTFGVNPDFQHAVAIYLRDKNRNEFGLRLDAANSGSQDVSDRTPGWLRRIDHLTYAVTADTIESAKDFWEGLGGKLRKRMDDVRAGDSLDSMMLWEVIFNEGTPDREFFVALVAGIDRQGQSQVNRFVGRHGIHSLQHVAYDVGDMDAFRPYFEDTLGGNLLSETLRVPDESGGFTEQVFGWGYQAGNLAEVEFPEFLARSNQAARGVQVREKAGVDLHDVVRIASNSEMRTSLVDFARLPASR